VLETRLGKECADFYAEPVPDRDGFRVDWYAPLAGEPRRLDDLPEAEREAVEDRINDILSRLRGLSDALANEIRSDADRTRAQIVAQSISFPTREQVFVVGEQPVVTYWGFVREGADGPSTPIFGRAAGAAKPIPPPAPTLVPVPVDGSGRRWWLWLLGLLALLLLAGWFFKQCPPVPPLSPPGETPAPVETPAAGSGEPVATATAIGDDLASLRAERDRLRSEYERKRAQCGPQHEVPPREYNVGPGGEVTVPGDESGGADGAESGEPDEPIASPGAAPSVAVSAAFSPDARFSPSVGGGEEDATSPDDDTSPAGPDADRSSKGPSTPGAKDASPAANQPTPGAKDDSPAAKQPTPGANPSAADRKQASPIEAARTQNPDRPPTPAAPQKSGGKDGGGINGGGGDGGGDRGPGIPIPPTLLPPDKPVPTPPKQVAPTLAPPQAPVATPQKPPAAVPTAAAPAQASPALAPTSAAANPTPAAKQGDDPKFAGTWKGEADLAADGSQKRERIPVTVALDAQGNGTIQMHRPGGAICEAPVKGRAGGGKLDVQTTTPASCSDGQRYRALDVHCQPGAGGVPECFVDQDGERSRLERSR